MAPIHTIQPTFAGGEFAPAMHSRVELAKFPSALRRAKNIILHPEGGASNRTGTMLVREVKDSSKLTRLIPFEYSDDQTYNIEFGNLYVRFLTADGTVMKAATISGATAANPVVVTATAHGFSNGDTIEITGVAGMTQLNGNTYTIANKTANNFQLSGVNGTAYTAYVSGGLATDLLNPYEVVTDYLEADLALLKVTQSADVLYIAHPSYPPQTLIRNVDSPPSWSITDYEAENGPFMPSNIDANHTMTIASMGYVGIGVYSPIGITSSVPFFDQGHVGALLKIVHQLPATYINSTHVAVSSSSRVYCGGDWGIVTYGTWTGTVSVEKTVDYGVTWTTLRTLTSNSDANHSTSGSSDGPFEIRVTSNVSAGSLRVQLSTDPYEHTTLFRINTVTNSTTITADPNFTISPYIGSLAASADWAEGSFSAYRGYPSVVSFFEDRIVFAATDTEPQTLWAGQTSNYLSFGRSNPLEDSDGISINLPSRKLNRIKNIVGLKDIITLTSASDWTVGPGTSGAMTPSSVSTKVQGQRGCSDVAPVLVGNRVICVMPQGSAIRDIGYNFQSDSFEGMILSTYSSHLVRGYEVIDMAYQQEPDSIVWAVRSDGVLLSMTYVPEQETLSWSWHETDGEVESISCIPGDGFDQLWMIVKRTIGGQTKRFIEKMVERMPTTEPRDQFFVDCGLTYDEPLTITGSTAANPVVVTCPAHGLTTGNSVDLSDIVWVENAAGEQPEQLNGTRFVVGTTTTNTFSLVNIDTGVAVNGSAYTAYVSGGYARKVVTAVSGLAHLEGKTVAILAGGSVHAPQVVVSGSITLTSGASIVHAGLAYESDLWTLPPELKLQDGTSHDRKKQIAQITLRLQNTVGGKVGSTEDNLRPLVQRTDEPWDSPVELYTGPVHKSLGGTYSDDTGVFIRQDDPLPITVLAILPRVQTGG